MPTKYKLFKVHLGTQNLWFSKEDFDANGNTFLARPEHAENGELITLRGDLSYAHCYPDNAIRRYGKIIGTVEDLVEGWVH